jgi:cytochrome P450
MGPMWRIYSPSKFISGMKVINRFIDPFVDQAVQNPEILEEHSKKVNFVDALSQVTRDRTVLRDQVVNILLAGRDTTAATLSWLFYELAYHPEIYSKLRQEVLDSIGVDGKPTYEDLKSMKYLQYCLNEGTSFL